MKIENNKLIVEFDIEDKLVENMYSSGSHMENSYCLHYSTKTKEWYLAYRIDLHYKDDVQLGSNILLLETDYGEPLKIIEELSKRLITFTTDF